MGSKECVKIKLHETNFSKTNPEMGHVCFTFPQAFGLFLNQVFKHIGRSFNANRFDSAKQLKLSIQWELCGVWIAGEKKRHCLNS